MLTLYASAGIGCRFGLHSMPDSKGIYIAEYLFVVLSPCAFIAADYVLLGRLARHLHADQHLLIRPQRIVLFFVLSDVTTFLIQAAGGSVLISANSQKTIDNGNHVGLVVWVFNQPLITSHRYSLRALLCNSLRSLSSRSFTFSSSTESTSTSPSSGPGTLASHGIVIGTRSLVRLFCRVLASSLVFHH
jgi:hypothetical protein